MNVYGARASVFSLTGMLSDGSFYIERYVWTEGAKSGVQWLVYAIRDSEFVLAKVCRTRTRAAEWVAELQGGFRGGV